MESPVEIKNYINGHFTDSISRAKIDTVNPSTGEILGTLPRSNEEDVQLAIQSAKKAFPMWSGISPKERSSYLNKISELILTNKDELAVCECLDSGKPLSLAQELDIPRSAENFRFFAQAIEQYSSECFIQPGVLNYTIRSPLGVVVTISPWNLPLYLFTWKIAPALAAGNCVVAKPSELTPLTAYKLCQLVEKSGLPPGVLNVIHGYGNELGHSLITHPFVKAISFTGSTQTGRFISETAAPYFKKLSLEMGGKNASLVFASKANKETAEVIARSAFLNQGEICLCGSRILIEESCYSHFRDLLIQEAKKWKVGNPMSLSTKLGALVSKNHFEKVLNTIEAAKKLGGQIVAGGKRPELEKSLSNGFYLEPTLIEGLDSSSSINQEEIFGPVATLIPFKTEEEAVSIANSTRYGLSASIWTDQTQQSKRIAEKLETGIVWINTWMLRDLRTPFGGIKESGLGREGGRYALDFFTETKNICERY